MAQHVKSRVTHWQRWLVSFYASDSWCRICHRQVILQWISMPYKRLTMSMSIALSDYCQQDQWRIQCMVLATWRGIFHIQLPQHHFIAMGCHCLLWIVGMYLLGWWLFMDIHTMWVSSRQVHVLPVWWACFRLCFNGLCFRLCKLQLGYCCVMDRELGCMVPPWSFVSQSWQIGLSCSWSIFPRNMLPYQHQTSQQRYIPWPKSGKLPLSLLLFVLVISPSRSLSLSSCLLLSEVLLSIGRPTIGLACLVYSAWSWLLFSICHKYGRLGNVK